MADLLLELAEAGQLTNPLQSGLQTMIVQEEPLLDRIRFESLGEGRSSYDWFRESRIPASTFRSVNGTWDADRGIVIPKQENLSILGGEVEIDRYIISTQGSKLQGTTIKSMQFEMRMRSMEQKWLETLLEGDSGVDPNAFDGLRPRVSGTAADFDQSGSSTSPSALTLEQLDEIIDFVVGLNGGKAFLCNQFLRRKINALVRAAGQAREMVSTTFGEQMDAYANVPIIVIQRRDDQSSILGFDEDAGDGNDDSASLYCVNIGGAPASGNFSETFSIFGILGNGGAWEVEDFGEQEAAPRILGRAELYVGLVTPHPRSFARDHSIAQL